jgi:Leucine-rich repeat (LRR) protein
MELNPGFDGKLNPTVEKGVVTSLKLLTDPATDLSPVVALAGLKTLSVGGQAGRHSLLNDLSPLRGLMLTSMSIGDSDVADLSPLQGMPVAFLNCSRSKVKDLSPLERMKLTEISCSETAVSDLSPLQGMPLTYLYCNNTQVSDLSPLSGMPTLGSLDVRRTKVTPASVAALKKALPNCKIEWDGAAGPKTP